MSPIVPCGFIKVKLKFYFNYCRQMCLKCNHKHSSSYFFLFCWCTTEDFESYLTRFYTLSFYRRTLLREIQQLMREKISLNVYTSSLQRIRIKNLKLCWNSRFQTYQDIPFRSVVNCVTLLILLILSLRLYKIAFSEKSRLKNFIVTVKTIQYLRISIRQVSRC